MYNMIGSISLLAIILALLFGSTWDYLKWNAEYERRLIKELNERHGELGIDEIPLPVFSADFSGRGERQNVSASLERTESDMEWTQGEIDDYEGLCTRMNAMAAKGEEILERIKKQEPDFATKNFGKFVQVNVETGEYILANSSPEANDEFARRFGAGTPCFEEHIGYPIYVGGAWRNILAA
jgi:hypothetical protein